ncbi:MAG: DUF1697 domain-containing protein [Gammaproteobacteria bacterium]|nr:DUF1697 domain-containing protein [Gammaproteobacteria bacterium]MBU1724107.1 DUF1697 domain-containing protein [Gammaproteobacteria bacterium]MBU2006817.1 DUF1697 domain-containing protein [Gammaproteobacteria bacterium]
MSNYIALFRGINVGGRHILPMSDLAEILYQLGCDNIQTYIQSGNVVFQNTSQQTSALAKSISTKVAKVRGFAPKVLLLEAADIEVAIANNPFPTENGKALHFFFMEAVPPSPDLETLAKLKLPSEDFKLLHNVFYLYAPDGIGHSKLAEKVEKYLGTNVTARNWNTVSKLLEMVK